MDWIEMKRRFIRLYEDVTGSDLEDERNLKGNGILYVMRVGITIVFYIICCTWHGRFFSGIDYAGHGIWGWIGLWLSCTWAATIVSIVTMWFLKLTPQARPHSGYFILGIVFLLLFVGGLSRHVQNPVIGEILVGSAASVLLYLSLFAEKH